MDRRVYEESSSDEIGWVAVMAFLLVLIVAWLVVEI